MKRIFYVLPALFVLQLALYAQGLGTGILGHGEGFALSYFSVSTKVEYDTLTIRNFEETGGWCGDIRWVFYIDQTIFNSRVGLEVTSGIGQAFSEYSVEMEKDLTFDIAFGPRFALFEMGSGGIGSVRIGASAGVGLNNFLIFYTYMHPEVSVTAIPGLLSFDARYKKVTGNYRKGETGDSANQLVLECVLNIGSGFALTASMRTEFYSLKNDRNVKVSGLMAGIKF